VSAFDLSKPVVLPQTTEQAEAATVLVEKLKDYGIDATALPGMVKVPNTIEIVINAK
jgi:hypothetical protein